MYEYENLRRIAYDCVDGEGTAYFIPVCPKCRRFIKADNSIMVSYRGITDKPNADCTKCGRVAMPSDGIL